MKMKKKNTITARLIALIKFGIKLLLIYTTFTAFIILFFRIIPLPVSAFVYSNIDEPFKSLFTSGNTENETVAIDKISRYAVLAVIASEDQRFFDHFGFDFEQIEKAMKENVHRKRIRGASTITMQVAKNMFLWSWKSFVRKGFEAYYTVLLELLWSKEGIIETYLNIAEMGKGIYGIQAASKIYYRKDAENLSVAEAAMLAVVLPNPKKRDPRKPSRYLIRRRNEIIEQMNLLGGINFIKKEID